MGEPSTRPVAHRRLAAGLPTLTFVGAFLAILGLGVLATRDDHPTVAMPPNVTSALVSGCETDPQPPALPISVSWTISNDNPPLVSGVTLDNVPAGCASLPITVSLTDGSGAVIASTTTAPATSPTDPTTVTFDFTELPNGDATAGVSIPAIEGLSAAIPDPVPSGGSVVTTVLAGSNATTSVSISDATIALTFPTTGGGSITISNPTPGTGGHPEPQGFALSASAPIYFDVSAGTTSYTPPVTVCIFLDPALYPGESPRLWHYESGAWVDATTTWDPATGELCGSVDHFSPFGVGPRNPASATATQVSASSITLGGSVTDTATVTSAAGPSGTPSGTVTFTYCFSASAYPVDCTSGTVIGTGTLSGSGTTATATSPAFTPGAVGFYLLHASWPGDANYSGSSDPGGSTEQLRVLAAPLKVPSMVALTTSPTSSVYGAPVTLRATVDGTAGTATGTVTFVDYPAQGSGTTLASCTLNAGSCAITVSTLGTGNHKLVATYGGNNVYLASLSSVVPYSVAKAATLTTISTVSPGSPVVGQTASFTATVTPPYSGFDATTGQSVKAPTGKVTFKDGTSTIGSCSLAAPAGTGPATCSFSIRFSTAGSHPISALYGGSTTYQPSAGSATVTVRKATPTAMLSASTSTPKKAKTVTLSASVTSAAGTPTGTVTFTISKAGSPTVTVTVALSSGKATYSGWPTSSTSPGTWTVTATYSGDSNFEAVGSNSITVTVQ